LAGFQQKGKLKSNIVKRFDLYPYGIIGTACW
jgi:hypothetical protein